MLALLQTAATGLRAARALRMSAFEGLARQDVVVLGGGFGGLYTALRLRSLDWGEMPCPRVTLVDRSDRFAFLPMLYELTTGEVSCWEVAPKFDEARTRASESASLPTCFLAIGRNPILSPCRC